MSDDEQEMTWDKGLRKSYDQEARQYDARRYISREGQQFNRLELNILRGILPTGPGKWIFDVPAGTGRLSVELGKDGTRVVGGDLSLNMLNQAAAKAAESHRTDLWFTQANAGQLPFRDGTFDAVVSFKFFHLVPNDVKPVLIREMIRVLKPGGKLIAEFNSPYYGGLLAFLRYYFRKKHPGGMRMKCLFPDQVTALFEGVRVRQIHGVKLPLSGAIESMLGRGAVDAFTIWFGKLPMLRYLSYALIVEAEKPSAR
jgi:ubiquinone/menaquinone biosynthesis C-methylase UbiE